ncbi:MAG: DUF4167 domain-containing protein [Asticcacaulis sp.]
MKDFRGMKRQRSRNRKPSGNQNNPNRAYESNGPEGSKVRGNAQTIYEKYQQLARDANSSGDRVLAENYLQHAEHYFRLIRQMQPQRPVSEFLKPDPFSTGYDFDEDLEAEAVTEAEQSADADNGATEAGDDQPRQDNRRDRNDRNDRGDRNDRNRDRDRNADRARDERPREDRARDDRPRDEGDDGIPRRESRRERYERRRQQRLQDQEQDLTQDAPQGDQIASTEPISAPATVAGLETITPEATPISPVRETVAEPVAEAPHMPAFLRTPTRPVAEAVSEDAEEAPVQEAAEAPAKKPRAPRRKKTETVSADEA